MIFFLEFKLAVEVDSQEKGRSLDFSKQFAFHFLNNWTKMYQFKLNVIFFLFNQKFFADLMHQKKKKWSNMLISLITLSIYLNII